jgi:hypothetical protein
MDSRLRGNDGLQRQYIICVYLCSSVVKMAQMPNALLDATRNDCPIVITKFEYKDGE